MSQPSPKTTRESSGAPQSGTIQSGVAQSRSAQSRPAHAGANGTAPVPSGVIRGNVARLRRAGHWFERDLWQRDLVGLPTFRRFWLHSLRMGFLIWRGLKEHESFFRAAALTYTTVLSLVPLLAFAFALAKGFGAYDKLVQDVVDPFLDGTFGSRAADVPIAESLAASGGSGTVLVAEPNQLRQAFDQLLSFVAETNVANLGGVGLVVLVFTVLKLMGHIENAFNSIWGVGRSRTLVRKFADYLSIVAITPLLLIAASASRAAFASPRVLEFLREELMLEPVVEVALRIVPFLGLWVAFTVLGLVMPNTRVRLRSALIGGFFGAVAWSSIQLGYVKLQWGVSQYNALYAGFAAIPLFLVWVWLSWIAVLFAAEVAYADQHSEAYTRKVRGGALHPGQRRTLALALAVQSTEAFLGKRAQLDLEDLLVRFVLPERELLDVLTRLEDANILARLDAGESRAWTLARDPGTVRTSDVLAAVDGPSELDHLLGDSRADSTLANLRDSLVRDPANRSLREMAEVPAT